MTITPFDIYLVSLASKVLFFFEIMAWIFGFCSIVAFAILFVACAENATDEEKSVFKKYANRLAVAFISIMMAYTLIPNSKTIAAMLLVPAVVNNEHVQNSAGNALEALEEMTKQWLKDTVKGQRQDNEKQEASI